MKKLSFCTFITLLLSFLSVGVWGQTIITFNGFNTEFGYGLTFGEDLPDPGIPESQSADGFLFSINDTGGGCIIVGNDTEGYSGSYCLYDNNNTPNENKYLTISEIADKFWRLHSIFKRSLERLYEI